MSGKTSLNPLILTIALFSSRSAMKHVAVILVLAALLFTDSALPARDGTDDAPGVDPARIDDVVKLLEPFDAKLRLLIGRSLEFVSIQNRFPVRTVRLGPVAGKPGFDGRLRYTPYAYLFDNTGGSIAGTETEPERTYRFLIENPVVESIESVDQGNEAGEGPDRQPGRSIEKVVRMTYDFVIAFDDDTRDDKSYKIVMPMDVTVHGESTHGPREGDGCTGWWDEHRMLKVSYGTLRMATVNSD